MAILQKILDTKKAELEAKKELKTTASLKVDSFFYRDAVSLKASLLKEGSSGIIAEFKRKSPSRGWFHPEIRVQDVVTAYNKDAAGISILTDVHFFGGANQDIIQARAITNVPILRKEFIIDPFQIVEAKAIGADVVLLIAACLTPEMTRQLARVAKDCGLEVLLELHAENEMDHICDQIDIIGVNNRNLDTLEISIDTSYELIKKLDTNRPVVSESGISAIETIVSLNRAGFKGFLIGENFMKQPQPAVAFAEFMTSLNQRHED